MSNISLSTPSDIAATIPAILGFRPSESLVALGLGGNVPTARVDTGDTLFPIMQAVGSLAPAASYWVDRGVILGVFSDADTLGDHVATFQQSYPLVKVVVAIRVTSEGVIYDVNGEPVGLDQQAAPDAYAARHIADDRDALVIEADSHSNAVEVLRIARASYKAGNGARAWCFLDRYVELIGGTQDKAARDLDHALSNAVNPNVAP